jgi:uncharacterized membrane protein YphA (DoxX/SURF4 family)
LRCRRRDGVEAFLLLIARIVAGVMFCVSGWNKVFTDAGRERMVHTLSMRGSRSRWCAGARRH